MLFRCVLLAFFVLTAMIIVVLEICSHSLGPCLVSIARIYKLALTIPAFSYGNICIRTYVRGSVSSVVVTSCSQNKPMCCYGWNKGHQQTKMRLAGLRVLRIILLTVRGTRSKAKSRPFFLKPVITGTPLAFQDIKFLSVHLS